MSVRLVALFSVSWLLLGASASHAVVKRNAPDGQLYVVAKRGGCESVQSQEPCPVSWQLSPFHANIYKGKNRAVINFMQLYKMGGEDDQCLDAIKRAICSADTPRCSASDGSLDYGNRTEICQNLYHSCSAQTVSDLIHEIFCDPLRTGKHPISECVAPSTPTEGACPHPEFKMEQDFLINYQAYSKIAVAYLNQLENFRDGSGEKLFSPSCVSKIREIDCSQLYCSANESHLLTTNDQEECNNTIEVCSENLPKASNQSRRLLFAVRAQLQAACNTFPIASSAQLVVEPPTVAVPSPTGAGTSPTSAGTSPTSAGTSPTVASTSAGDSLRFQNLIFLLILCLTIKTSM